MPVLECQVPAEGVALLRLNRPERMNALDVELIGALRSALAEHAANEQTKAVIITGTGRAFCSGADLVSFLSGASLDPASVGRQVARSMDVAFNPLMRDMMAFSKPIVTAINGMAAGGGAAMALCADVILAGKSAKLKFVQVPQLGCVADLGGNWLLQRLAGRATALGAILLGETISADRAAGLGLIWEVIEDGALVARAVEVAVRLAQVPREAVVGTRRLVDMSATATFDDILECERLYQHELAGRPDLAATVAAFLAEQSQAAGKQGSSE